MSHGTGNEPYALLDGNPGTSWQQDRNKTLPIDLVIDLGSEKTLAGFKYFPDQGTTRHYNSSQNT